ncbi:MAG: hypothetical protein Q9202_006451 [Teloschistes flavicans]
MGKAMGVLGPVINSGALLGPMVGGLLLSSVGYWRTWLVAVVMIVVDLALRLAMIDTPRLATAASEADDGPSDDDIAVSTVSIGPEVDERLRSNSFPSNCATKLQRHSSTSSMESSRTVPTHNAVFDPSVPTTTAETTPLLPTVSHRDSPPTCLSNAGYCYFILRQRRIVSSIFITLVVVIVYTSLTATLALHVENVFSWGPGHLGLLFLAFVGPSVLLGPFAGWLRDSVGVRWPTIIGTGLAAPCYVLLGLTGDERFHWVQGNLGKRICIGSLVLTGVAIELTVGMGIVEGVRMSSSLVSRKLEGLLISMDMTF